MVRVQILERKKDKRKVETERQILRMESIWATMLRKERWKYSKNYFTFKFKIVLENRIEFTPNSFMKNHKRRKQKSSKISEAFGLKWKLNWEFIQQQIIERIMESMHVTQGEVTSEEGNWLCISFGDSNKACGFLHTQESPVRVLSLILKKFLFTLEKYCISVGFQNNKKWICVPLEFSLISKVGTVLVLKSSYKALALNFTKGKEEFRKPRWKSKKVPVLTLSKITSHHQIQDHGIGDCNCQLMKPSAGRHKAPLLDREGRPSTEWKGPTTSLPSPSKHMGERCTVFLFLEVIHALSLWNSSK